MSKDTEISVGRFLTQIFTPITLVKQHQSVISNVDVTEVWLTENSEVIHKVRKMQVGVKGVDTPSPDEKEVEKTFWITGSPDGWVIKKRTNHSIILKHTSGIPQRHITPT